MTPRWPNRHSKPGFLLVLPVGVSKFLFQDVGLFVRANDLNGYQDREDEKEARFLQDQQKAKNKKFAE